jgi:hypothetical protein
VTVSSFLCCACRVDADPSLGWACSSNVAQDGLPSRLRIETVCDKVWVDSP